MSAKEIEIGFKGISEFQFTEAKNIVDALIDCKLASSKRESREFINNGAVMVNGIKVTDLEYNVSSDNAIDGLYTVIRRGKKKYALIRH